MLKTDPNIKLIVIDSFCGAGGVTEGFHRAKINERKIAKVIAEAIGATITESLTQQAV